MTALPEAFVSRMRRQLGDELPAFLRALSLPAERGIRMNGMKPFEGMEAYTGGESIPWAEGGYYLSESSKAGATVFHEAGAFYLQEPAAMLPAEVMDVRPGERILDLCAAPGGKATQMALKLRGTGLIVCNEPVSKRCAVLSRNMERIGIPNSIVTNSYPEALPHAWDGVFDGVLVDAPCSGEGMFRRDPETRLEWTAEQASGCAARQDGILDEAARFVRPGGRIVYATCTYHPEENEGTVRRFLDRHPEFSCEAFTAGSISSSDGCYLCLPHRIRGEGQFAAKLRRSGSAGPAKLTVPFPRPTAAETETFSRQFPMLPKPNAKFGNTLAWVPEAPGTAGVKILRAGLHLGETRGKTAVPDHAAAVSIGAGDFGIPAADLTAGEAAAYIAGEEIRSGGTGWLLMQYRGLRLGWGKGSEGRIRNHYPKGLRKGGILTEP